MKNKLVSVIITTYKREPQMLLKAVKSVINQTYRETEIIVVDDSPSDYKYREDVRKMVKDVDKSVVYIQHESNKGACAARNTGIKNSKGDFIAFLDDDDEWLESKLEKQMTKFADVNVGLVYCRQYVINLENGKKYIGTKPFFSGNVYEHLILDNFIGSTSFVVMRKSVIDICGMFDVDLKSAQDYDLWLRASKVCQVDYVDEPLVNYYIHSGERISGNPKNKIQGLERLNQKNWDYISKNRMALWIRTIKLAPVYLWNKQYKDAIHAYIKAIKTRPFCIRENLKYIYQGVALLAKNGGKNE